MAFDGTLALVTGEYLTPSEGPYAGQLGPWHHIVSAIGIDPRSTFMKLVFLVYGLAWLAVIVAFIRRRPRSWAAMLLAALGSSWNLFFGTMTSVVLVALLLIPGVRRAHQMR